MHSHELCYESCGVRVQVARCTKIINPGTDEAKYVINVKQIAKASDGLKTNVGPHPHTLQVVHGDTDALYIAMCCVLGLHCLIASRLNVSVKLTAAGVQPQFVVGLGEKVAPTDIEESMRVG